MPRLPIPSLPPIVPYSLLVFGTYLGYSAIRNVSPLQELRGALSGVPARPAIDTASSTPPAAGTGPATAGVALTPATGDNDDNRRTEPPLVALPYNSGHRVTAQFAARYVQWVAAFGEPIPVTDSYRSYQSQAASHAADSHRFGSPDTSLHVEGNAVDVNLTKLQASYTGNPAAKAKYVKLWNTAKAAGLCAARYDITNPAGLGKGTQDEPWHFATRCG
jgi:hypothetical protein